MQINIKGAKTHNSEEHLCLNCKYSVIVRGHATSDEFVRCNELDTIVRWRVSECSSYMKKGTLSLNEMREQAFILEFRKGGKVGFVRAREYEKERGYGSAVDWES